VIVRTAEGVDLWCEVDGQATAAPVLLCHSIGTSSDLWAPQVDQLATRWRAIRHDTRGHGRSSVPPGEYSVDDLGHDAIAVMDALEVGQAHVVGVSMGGLVALWLGVHAAPRVSSLVLAHTAARLGTVERWTDRIARVRAAGMAGIADLAIAAWFTPAFRERRPETVHRLRQQLERCSPDGYAGCSAALRDADLRGVLGTIRAPTLVIAGTRDAATTMADADTLRAGIPGAALATIDTAHLGNVEQPDAFTALVESFVADVDQGRSR
jgi:3-oxoadipate enol-lactonase